MDNWLGRPIIHAHQRIGVSPTRPQHTPEDDIDHLILSRLAFGERTVARLASELGFQSHDVLRHTRRLAKHGYIELT